MTTETDAPVDGATTEILDTNTPAVAVEPGKETETAPEGEAEPVKATEPTDEDSETDDDKPRKRPSRTDRLKERIRELSEALEVERGRKGSSSSELPKAPQEADFNGDYQAYERAQRAFETEQAVRRVLGESDAEKRAVREQELRTAQAKLYAERAVEAKSDIPDFDQVLNAVRGEDVRADVADFIRESEKGPFLAYHLAKNPGQIRALNGLSPTQAARELARIEARLSIPTPKKQTSAPAPMKPVAGGAAPSADISKMSMEEYAAYRKKQGA